ncbi:MAG: OmpA family protein [Paludibacteraceae bacterium]|nr:OmpA family protein [Paludibacteraceae bacterium]
MRYFRLVIILLLAFMMVVPSQDAMAQRRRKKKKKEEKEKKDLGLTHCLGLYGGLGYSAFLNDIENSKTPGGAAGLLGVQYMLKKHKPGDMNPRNMFTFAVGIEPMILNSTLKMNDFTYMGPYNYNLSNRSDTMTYIMDFEKYRESMNRLSLNVPIMFGGQFSRYYFQVGAKVGLGLWGGYTTKTDVITTVYDNQLIDIIGSVPTHGLETQHSKTKGSLKFDLDLVVSAEFGVVMDEWMPAAAMMVGKGRKKIPLSYRLGLFMDYGVMNLNPDKGSKIIATNREDYNGPLTSFNYADGTSVPGPAHDVNDPAHRVTINPNYTSVSTNSVLASDYWKNGSNKLNSFVFGAKFTVLFQVSPQPKPIKKKPRPRPKPKQVKIPTYPPFFYCVALDGETDKVIPAHVTLTRIDGSKDTAFIAQVDPSVGFVQNQMVSERFLINVKCRGYMDYNDTVYQIDNDTVYAQLMPIKKNAVVILRNLLFDTDKTIIKNTSVQSLEDLYKLLSENPTLKIQITGHTDNVGKEKYNQKLSEGRAKAVYMEMVKRGIDPKRMTWRGAGELEPIESNDTPEGRAENRRVEFMIL